MLKTLVTLIAAAATLASAAIAPVDYIPALRDNPIGLLLAMFLMFTSMIYIGYVIFNVFSGLMGQGDAGRDARLWWIDYVSSWIAFWSFNLILLWVVLGVQGIVPDFPTITTWADVPSKYWVLLGLVLFSWLDVFVLQGHKHTAAWQYFQTQRAIVPAPAVAPAPAPPAAPPVAPPAPLPVPAPANVGVGIVGVLLLLLFAIICAFAIMSFSGGWTDLRKKVTIAEEADKVAKICYKSEFVRNNGNAREFVTIPYDC